MVAVVATPAGAVLTINGVTVPKDPSNPTYVQVSSQGYSMYADPMIQSTETFAFQSVAHYRTHCGVRDRNISTITQMKAGGGIDFDYGEAYADRSLMTDLFPNPAHPGVISAWFKAKKANTKTSAIALSVEFGVTRSDCRAAAVCSVLIAHNDAPGVGATVVDAQVPPGTFRSDTFVLVQDATDTNTVIPGDVRYMINDGYSGAALAYQETLPAGKNEDQLLWNGEWTICVGTDSYTGLGIPARSEAKLRQVLRTNLAGDANITLTDLQANAQIKFIELKRLKILPP
jgi:hypothetical protein